MLPAGWASATVEELTGVGGLIGDGDWVESKDQDPSGEVRLTQLADVGEGIFRDRSARFMTRNAAERLRCTYLAAGDVLIARMPDPIGRACVFPGLTQPAVTAVDVMIWRTDGLISNAEWFARWVNSPVIRKAMADGAGGTTRQRISGGRVKELELPTPPLAEQRRIVAKLDALTARLGRARAELDRVPVLADQLRQSALKGAFRGVLTAGWREAHPTVSSVSARQSDQVRTKFRVSGSMVPPFAIPSTWRWFRLPELGDLDRGKSRHRPRNDPRLFGGSHPFVQTGQVRTAGQFLTQFSDTYSDFGLAQSRKWPIGTVCITIAANIAETAILGIEACFPDSVVGYIADADKTSAEFIEYFLRTAKVDLARFAPATAQKNINLDTLASVYIPVPPLAEQAAIVSMLNAAFARADRLEAEAARARALIDRLESAILAKAFRGELVPQDPNDEPASVLLDRIRAERAAAPKAKRGRRLLNTTG